MTVREAVNLLCSYTRYKAIGAHSGKKLFDSMSSEERKEKFMDCEVTERPFFCELKAEKDIITRCVSYCAPIICIWVSGE